MIEYNFNISRAKIETVKLDESIMLPYFSRFAWFSQFVHTGYCRFVSWLYF